MPLSSKKVIEFINGRTTPFTLKEAVNQLLGKKLKAGTKSKKSRKTKPYNPRRDTQTIEETLRALHLSSFLQKERRTYRLVKPLRCQGVLVIEKGGNGKIYGEPFDEVFIRKRHLGDAHNGDEVEVAISGYQQGGFTGEILQVMLARQNLFFALYHQSGKNVSFFHAIDVRGEVTLAAEVPASERSTSKIYLLRREKGTLAGSPRCSVVAAYSRSDEAADFERIRLKHDLPADWSELPYHEHLPDEAPSDEMRNRRDLSRLHTVTIDGQYAKDFDDAISLEIKGKRRKLFVHIADVSAYVKPGGYLDREARARGNSYYIGNRVIPMLPEEISNGLCSLNRDSAKLAITVEMDYNSAGVCTGYTYYRSRIMVDRRLTYREAQQIIDSGAPKKLSAQLRAIRDLTTQLRSARVKQGRLDLALSDEELEYNGDSVVDIVSMERLETHSLIEECMLSANEIVARELKLRSMPSLYRVHEQMSDESFRELGAVLKLFNVSMEERSGYSDALMTVIEKVRGSGYEQVISLLVLKSLMQANYGPEPLGHFGLGFKDYTHFTSPIRRYADLVVHRSLKSLMDEEQGIYSQGELSAIGEEISALERIAQKGERDMVKLKSCRLLSGKEGTSYDAVVTGISRSGFFVTLKEKPIEGMVPLRNLTDDYYLVQEDEFTVVGRKYGTRYRLGDDVRVTLQAADIERMRIDFDIAQ